MQIEKQTKTDNKAHRKDKKESKNLTILKKDPKSNSKKKKDKDNINYTFADYLSLENANLILSYGPQIYEYSRFIDGLSYDLKESEVKMIDILKPHSITHEIRTKLVDWIFEVLFAYKCDDNTFYLTMHLIDAYLKKVKSKLENSDIHLLGVTCLYIASKFEDMSPLDLETIKTRIAHNKFTDKEIRIKEREIMKTLEFKIITANMAEFIRNFIFDFVFNNNKVITKLNFSKEIDVLEKTAIYISKIVLHSALFSGFKNSLKAIALIILAFDLTRAHLPSFSGQLESFTNEWIKFLVEQSRYEPDHILQMYNKIKEYYESFDSLQNIQHNFKKNCTLPLTK